MFIVTHNTPFRNNSSLSQPHTQHASPPKNGWSRTILQCNIESDLFHRSGKAVSNFEQTLPAPDSDLAQQTLKDPYNFDFLTLTTDAREKDLETALLKHIRNFLLELRHTFGTHLAMAGVAPRIAMAAMRHSSLNLTMNVYTDPALLDVAGALNALPDMGNV